LTLQHITTESKVKAEWEAHDKGAAPVTEDLVVQAILASMDALEQVGSKTFQVHLRTSNIRESLRWLQRSTDARVTARVSTLKKVWLQRKEALGLAW